MPRRRALAGGLHDIAVGPGPMEMTAMPTDLAAALARRAARHQHETAAVLLLPVFMCVVTVAAALVSPSFAAGFREFGMF